MGIDLAPRFPSRVMTPGGTHEKVKVVAADGRLLVFGVDGDRRPALVASADIAAYPPDAAANVLRFATADGEEWVVQADSGCGCQHPLKRVSTTELLALVAAP